MRLGKLGTDTAILGHLSFEEAVDYVASIGLNCLEVACWPVGKADRRYAGVTHIDVDTLTEDKAKRLVDYAAERGVEIAQLAYSPNPLCSDEKMRSVVFDHMKNVLKAASMLGAVSINTFIGRDHTRSIPENMELVKKYWPEMIKYAEDVGVILTFENCPMYFTADEWPGGKNLAVNPKIWRELFQILDSDYFGFTYDPSHLVWQRMDYIKPIYEFKDKIVHVHLKDAKFYQDRFDEVGVFGHPLDYHSPKIPGLGDIDWGKFISALTDIGFEGCSFIEVEDKAFEKSQEDILNSLKISKNFISQYYV